MLLFFFVYVIIENMSKKVLEKLEYNKILEILERHATTYIGKELALNLIPSNDTITVANLLKDTTEATTLIYKNGNPPFFPIANIDIHLKMLESNGSLSIKGILDIANILKLSSDLKEYCDLYTENLYINPSIEKEIFNAILDENTINDKATDALYSIRRNIKKLEDEVRTKLSSFIRSTTYSKYVQEQVVTIRNNRFVIPVKQEYRSEIKGFIHDISSSGSTVFIEPISIFDLNNDLNSLKIQENIEIEKILQMLSSLFYPITDELKSNINIIGKLDLIFAKAKYSISINGVEPTINTEKQINLVKARHPLIDKNKVVPIDVNIGENYTTLVITGPNTGGKTVTLKTIGLLTLMACSGIHIPASERSSIYVFDNVLVDLGDEQSIAESLSTFSSHMLNIIGIIDTSSSESLILIDELGSGTDPIEGSSLAVSILEHFHNKGALSVVTTHYPEIKNYALTKEGFNNASSEFNVETLTPTYRILLGVPGKSYAFDISEKLGLPKEILDNAKSFIDNDTVNVEDLLKNINDDKITIENEKEKIEKLRISLEIENENKVKEEQDKLEKVKIEARDILLSAKQEADRVIKELNSSNDLKVLNKSRVELNSQVKELQRGITIKIGADTAPIVKQKPVHKEYIPAKSMSSEINVIGNTVDEAIFVIDKYLDSAFISSFSSIRIIHGKGTGALRTGIHKFLKTNKHVKSFRLGTFGEGEMGVTVVELK